MSVGEKNLVLVNVVYKYFEDLCGARQGGPTSTRGKKEDKQLSHDRWSYQHKGKEGGQAAKP